jgi:hypothetical protein
MGDPTRCAECEAILDELRTAAGVPTREQIQASREITLKAILSADEESIEELLEKHPYRVPLDGSIRTPHLDSKLRAVFRRLWEHRTRTGHSPRFWP